MDGSQTANDAKKKRRSSILKSQRVSRTPFSDLEFNVATPPQPDTTKGRRVSFSRRTGVAEFVTHEATTTWKNFYEEQNRSLESSDQDAGRRQPSIGHIGNRMFDQQFEEFEAEIDYIGTIGVPTSATHNNTGNITEQLALLETTERQPPAPQFSHDRSTFTEHSKLFREEMTNPRIDSISERINVDFSSINPLGVDDELDEIERDLKFDAPVVGPAFEEVSQYIEVDLNITRAMGTNESDMSITDTIHSPKKEVSHITTAASNASTSKNWMEDKENIVVNPYMPPSEENFAGNEVEKILVFDGKKVKYADINADLNDLIGDDNVEDKPKLASKSMTCDSTADMSITTPLQNIVKVIESFVEEPKSNKTVIYDEDAADMSITRPLHHLVKQIRNNTVEEPKETNKTQIYDDNAADMSMTRPLHHLVKQIQSNIVEEPKETNKTQIYDENAADMSMTRPLHHLVKQIQSNIVEEPKETNKTQIYDENAADMSMTRPLHHVVKEINRHLVAEEKENKTVVDDENTADMSITRPLQHIIKQFFSEEPILTNKTVVFDMDVADMSMTRPIPNLVQIKQHPAEDHRDNNKTVLYDETTADMSVTRPLHIKTIKTKPDIVDVPKCTNKTVMFDEVAGDMSTTRSEQHREKEEPSQNAPVCNKNPSDMTEDKTVTLENAGDMSLTRPMHTTDVRSVLFDEEMEQVERSNDILRFRKGFPDKSVTQIIVNDLWRSAAQINRTNKVSHDSKLDDMSFTKIAPPNILTKQFYGAFGGERSGIESRSIDCDLDLLQSGDKPSDKSLTQYDSVLMKRDVTDTESSLPKQENRSLIKAKDSGTESQSIITGCDDADPEKLTIPLLRTDSVTPSTDTSIYPNTTASESMVIEPELPTIESMIVYPDLRTKKVYIPDILFADSVKEITPPTEVESSSVIKSLLQEMSDCIQKTNIVIKAKIEPSLPDVEYIFNKDGAGSELHQTNTNTDISMTDILQPYLSVQTSSCVMSAQKSPTEKEKAKIYSNHRENDCTSIGISTSKETLNFDPVAPSVFQGNNQSIVVCQATNFQKTNQASDLKKLGLDQIATTLQEALCSVSKEETPTVNVLIMNVINPEPKSSVREGSENSVVNDEMPSNKGDEFHASSDKFTHNKIELSNPHFTAHGNKAPNVLSKKMPEPGQNASHFERKIKTISYDAIPTSSTLIDARNEEKPTTTRDQEPMSSEGLRLARTIYETGAEQSATEGLRLGRSIHCCDSSSTLGDDKQKKAILNSLLDMSGTCLGAGYEDKDVMATSSYSLYCSEKQMENVSKVEIMKSESGSVVPFSLSPNSTKSPKGSVETIFNEQLQKKLQQLQTSGQTSIYDIDEKDEEVSFNDVAKETDEVAPGDVEVNVTQTKSVETAPVINLDDTTELLKEISNITDKSTAVQTTSTEAAVQNTSPKKLTFVNDIESLNTVDLETKPQIDEQSTPDCAIVKTGKPVKSESKCSTIREWSSTSTSMDSRLRPDTEKPTTESLRKTKCSFTDPLSPERCSSQLSNHNASCAIGSTARLKDIEANSPPPIVSILKKSVYDEEHGSTNDKSAVIPSYTVSDCIKELMDDLVKPMADELPYDINIVADKNPSKCSVQLQANLITTSQIDLDEEPCIPEKLCSFVNEEAIETELRNVSVATEGNGKVRPNKSVIFDDSNPLNNVWLAPTNLTESHKYEPIDIVEVSPADNSLVRKLDNQSEAPSSNDMRLGSPIAPVNTNNLLTIDLTNSRCPYIRLSYPIRSGYTPSKDSMGDMKKETNIQNFEREKDLEVGVVMVSYEFDAAQEKLKAAAKDEKDTEFPTYESSDSNYLDANSGDKETHDSNNKHPSKKRRLSDQQDVSSSDANTNEARPKRHNCCQKYELPTTPRTDKRKSMTQSASDNVMKAIETPTCKSPLRKHRKGSSPEKRPTRADSDKKWMTSVSNDSNPYVIQSPTRDRKIHESRIPRASRQSPVRRKICNFNGRSTSPMSYIPARSTQVNMTVYHSQSESSRHSLPEVTEPDLISITTDCTMKSEPENFPVRREESDSLKVECEKELESVSHDAETSPIADAMEQEKEIQGESSTCQTDNESEICEDNIVEKINKLQFLGANVWEWETTPTPTPPTTEPWSFLLLRRRIRLSVSFTEADAFVDMRIRDIVIEATKDEAPKHLASLCVQYALDAMRPATNDMRSATDLPRILLRCAGVACLATQWLKSMWKAKSQLGCKLDGSVLSFKVANTKHRTVYEVAISMESTFHTGGIYPRAVSTTVSQLVAPQHEKLDEEVAKALETILCNWGHVPNTIWRVYRLLNKHISDDENHIRMPSV